MSLEQDRKLCSKLLITWCFKENELDMNVHSKDVSNLFTSKIILNKFNDFGIDIVLPDFLLSILCICSNSNPGVFQVMLKDLLNSIKRRIGSIPKGYVISTLDFALWSLDSFPLIDIPENEKKYYRLWNEQKVLKDNNSYNLCDTVEWWKEVME